MLDYGADLKALNNKGESAIDVALNHEIRQAIRDVEKAREHTYKRIRVADLLPQSSSSSDVGGEGADDDEDDDETS